MNHFILTRFNLHLWWNADKNNQPIQTENWLSERFRLFNKYTWPSLRAQTCQDFRWICLFDKDTPDKYKRIIEDYQHQWSNFIPVYCGEKATKYFQSYFAHLVKKYCNEEDKQIITTYLDNDDALAVDFVQEIQDRTANLKFNTVISYKYGIQYYEEFNLAVRIPYKNNHFLTYYERNRENIKTIWGFWHFSIFKYPNIGIELIDNKQKPMWIETIHEGNIDNDVKMTIHHHLLTEKNTLSAFGLPIQLDNTITSWNHFFFSFIPRFLTQIIRRGRNKLNK